MSSVMMRPHEDASGAGPRAPSEKPTNPKDALGILKPPLSTVPTPVVFEIGLGMLEGALKYGRHNYRAIGVRASVYYDATMRHLGVWWEGEDLDPDSKAGLHHVSKAIASLVVLRDAMIQGNWQDDRPPRSPQDWLLNMQGSVKALLAAYPNPVSPYTQQTMPKPEIDPYAVLAAAAETATARSLEKLAARNDEAEACRLAELTRDEKLARDATTWP
jgi:hypothetical protein